MYNRNCISNYYILFYENNNAQCSSVCKERQYIYIDLSKVIDTLNSNILIYKLHYYRITDIALLKGYMSNNMVNIMLMNLGLSQIKQACHRDQF